MTPRTLGIVGSGIMGAGIAECAALAGHDVVLRSRELTHCEEAIARIRRSLARRVERGAIPAEAGEGAAARITATSDMHDLAGCDLVIESVVEDMAAKRHVFLELDRICGHDTLLGTNTSTLPIVELAMATTRPDKVCGIHFFNPAPVMELVEIVRPITAADETVEGARSFAEACGKKAIVVKDQAGFVVNALLFPYLNNAVRLLEAQVASMEDIDAAMKGACGFPMGPFALLDLVGLDTSLAIMDALYEEHRDPNYAAVPRLRRMVAAHRLGRKSGEGFYPYPGS